MELEIRPEPTDVERAAIVYALERIADEKATPAVYRSAWRLTALVEAAQADDPEP